jgi:hypothetical protein
MSYINEALKKAQKEKDSRLTGYRPVIEPFPAVKTPMSGIKLAVGLFAAVLLLVMVVVIVRFFMPGKPSGTSDRQRAAVSSVPVIADKIKTGDMARPVDVAPPHPPVSEQAGPKEKAKTSIPSEISQMPVATAAPVRKRTDGEGQRLPAAPYRPS